MTRKKKKNQKIINKIDRLKHNFILSIRDNEGTVLETIAHTDYDSLILEGMERAKDANGYWEVFNSLGKRIDGSYEERN